MANYMEGAFNIAALCVGLLLLIESVRGIIADPGDPYRRTFFYLTSTALAVNLVGNLDVYAAINRAAATPNVARLLLDGVGLVLAWSVQSWVLHWTYPADEARVRAKRRIRLLLVALLLMTLFFLLAPIDQDTPSGFFIAAYGTSPWIWCYYATFTAYFGTTQVDLGRMSLRFLRLSGTGILRVSLWFLFAGSLFGVLILGAKAGLLIHLNTGWLPGWPDQLLTRVSQTGAFYCVALGATCATWLPRFLQWIALHVRYRQLFPLWIALRIVFPEVALEDQPRPTALPVRLDSWSLPRMRFRVARLVTEINDALLRLRPYSVMTPSPDPAIEAERIAQALMQYQIGATGDHQLPAVQRDGPADLSVETRWLADVGREWQILRKRLGTRQQPSPKPSTRVSVD